MVPAAVGVNSKVSVSRTKSGPRPRGVKRFADTTRAEWQTFTDLASPLLNDREAFIAELLTVLGIDATHMESASQADAVRSIVLKHFGFMDPDQQLRRDATTALGRGPGGRQGSSIGHPGRADRAAGSGILCG